ncbi:E3 ubiquitin-protein ligase TRIM69-like [Rhinoraja longicauda]
MPNCLRTLMKYRCWCGVLAVSADQVKSSIQSLTKYKSEIQQMEQQQKEKISGVLEQSHNLQSKIKSQFAELHQILTEKEQRGLADIREEEKKILNAMEKNLREIEENLNSIQEELFKLQQQMDQKDNVVFLKEEAGRKRRVRDEAKPLSVVDVALPIEKFNCPVSLNTAFKQTSDDFKQVSVTLDVETAHARLEVSEDRKRVRRTGIVRSLPDTGKRFTDRPSRPPGPWAFTEFLGPVEPGKLGPVQSLGLG